MFCLWKREKEPSVIRSKITHLIKRILKLISIRNDVDSSENGEYQIYTISTHVQCTMYSIQCQTSTIHIQRTLLPIYWLSTEHCEWAIDCEWNKTFGPTPIHITLCVFSVLYRNTFISLFSVNNWLLDILPICCVVLQNVNQSGVWISSDWWSVICKESSIFFFFPFQVGSKQRKQ